MSRDYIGIDKWTCQGLKKLFGGEGRSKIAQRLQEPIEWNVKLTKPFIGARIPGAIESKCVERVFSS
ncbi:hypothetical protein KDH_26470 [Dictyobacter sp. S3.2.2.5]|uniref:Uncharacterized protein n=1 Tax=Dictyobacter halimunensis TaxID=3026934 RepID=A0ABQ6FTG1_9CHLR|nr:hypothetical protein KDH_26470 [Dictyobacter sp. S3.2.2.5]